MEITQYLMVNSVLIGHNRTQVSSLSNALSIEDRKWQLAMGHGNTCWDPASGADWGCDCGDIHHPASSTTAPLDRPPSSYLPSSAPPRGIRYAGELGGSRIHLRYLSGSWGLVLYLTTNKSNPCEFRRQHNVV